MLSAGLLGGSYFRVLFTFVMFIFRPLVGVNITGFSVQSNDLELFLHQTFLVYAGLSFKDLSDLKKQCSIICCFTVKKRKLKHPMFFISELSTVGSNQ